MVPMFYYLGLCVFLFAIGVVGAIIRRNGLAALLCIALMFCAALLAFASGAQRHGDVDGQVWGILVIVVTAVELGTGFALLLTLFRRRKNVDINRWTFLKW